MKASKKKKKNQLLNAYMQVGTHTHTHTHTHSHMHTHTHIYKYIRTMYVSFRP